jgi:hypothetical protein
MVVDFPKIGSRVFVFARRIPRFRALKSALALAPKQRKISGARRKTCAAMPKARAARLTSRSEK